jgi:hypothetical protein
MIGESFVSQSGYDPYFIEDSLRYRNWLRTRIAISPRALYDGDDWFFKRTALWRLGQRSLYMSKMILQDRTGSWIEKLRKVRQAGSRVDDLLPLDSGLDEYERNVKMIVQEARRRSLRIVLMTQPTLWRATMRPQEQNLLWMGWRSKGTFYSTGALSAAMESYNERLLSTCSKVRVECIKVHLD